MHLDQIGLIQQSSDPRPLLREKCYQVSSAHVSGAKPDDLGRSTLHHQFVKEISIFGQNHESFSTSELPQSLVCWLIAQLCRSQANLTQCFRQVGGQIFVDQKMRLHEASSMVV